MVNRMKDKVDSIQSRRHSEDEEEHQGEQKNSKFIV